MKKFELTSETKVIFSRTLHRIKALVSFGRVEKDAVGGWIEKEDNLGQHGNAWVFGDAEVFGNAEVYGDAWVSGNARVYGDAEVFGNAEVYGDAWVSGNARVYGDAEVFGNARVSGDAEVSGDALVYGDALVSGDAVCRKTPTVITGLSYLIVIDDELVRVGCEQHNEKKWRGFSESEIKEMADDALEFYPVVIGILDALKR